MNSPEKGAGKLAERFLKKNGSLLRTASTILGGKSASPFGTYRGPLP
jgi:hypothetical protein